MTNRRIEERFRAARKEGRLAFIPYLTAGDPDLEASAELVREMDSLGSDLIEVGVPFSDPVADGVVNQKAAERALRAGADLPGILEMIEGVRGEIRAGIVLFTYYNPVHRFGVQPFARRASTAGLDAALIVDLPPEEGAPCREALRRVGVDTPYLLAPTSSDRRVGRIAASATGFLYYVSRTGVTGPRENLEGELRARLIRIRSLVGLPVVVGFGISRPEHLSGLEGVADGVVVGSAIVRLVGEGGTPGEIRARVRRFIEWIRPRGPG